MMSTSRALNALKQKLEPRHVSNAPVSLSFKLLMMLTFGQMVTMAHAETLNAVLTTDSQEYGVQIGTGTDYWGQSYTPDPQSTVDAFIKECGPFHDYENVAVIPYATPGTNHSIAMLAAPLDENNYVNLWRKNLTAVDEMLEDCMKSVSRDWILAVNAAVKADQEARKNDVDIADILAIISGTIIGVVAISCCAAALAACDPCHRRNNQPTQMRDLEQGRRRRRQRNNLAAVPALQVEGVSVDDRHDAFRDPISHDLMVDPVVCADGHSYSRHTITEWLRTHDTSPSTGERLEHKNLIPNHELKKAIEEYQALKEPEAAVEPDAMVQRLR